jgi:hypothetical protein
MNNYKDKKTEYTDTIDFLSNRSILTDTLRFNRKYRYVLKNINRFVYKEATAEQKGENLNTEAPEIFKGIKIPGFITGQHMAIVAADAVEPAPLPDCACISAEYLINSSASLRDAFTAYRTSGGMFGALATTFATASGINKRLEKLKMDVIHSWQQIDSDKRTLLLDSLGLTLQQKDTNNIYKKYDTIRNSAVVTYSIIQSSGRTITRAVAKAVSQYETCVYEMRREMRCMDSCCKKAGRMIGCLIYKSKEDSINVLNDCIDALQSFASDIKTEIQAGEEVLQGMQKMFDEGGIDAVQNNYNLLVAENFQLELAPFTAGKDIHEITFTAGAEGPLVFDKPAKRTIKIDVITCGGWKIDFSTGVFFNMGSNQFLGPDYYFENPTDSTKIIREASRTKKGMFSIGGLMHISPRINFFVRPAVSLGVSLTSGFDAFNFHGGLSAIIGKPGKANRIIITGGITLREVDLLNSRYALDVARADYPESIPVSKNFPVRGGFFALTYNLKGVNK